MSGDTWAIIIAIGVSAIVISSELRTIGDKLDRAIGLLFDIKTGNRDF